MEAVNKQTGPKTAQGKLQSSQNAIKHGLGSQQVLLPHESREEFMVHQQRIQQEFPVKCPEQEYVVEQIIFLRWQQMRNQRIMDQLCLNAYQKPIKHSEIDDYLGRIKLRGKSMIDVLKYGDCYVKTEEVLMYEKQQKIIEGVALWKNLQKGQWGSKEQMNQFFAADVPEIIQVYADKQGMTMKVYLESTIDPVDLDNITQDLGRLEAQAHEYCMSHEEAAWIVRAIKSTQMERVMAVKSNPNYERHLVRVNRDLEKCIHLYHKLEQRYIGQLPNQELVTEVEVADV